MKVKELIEALKEYSQEMDVVFPDEIVGDIEVHHIGVVNDYSKARAVNGKWIGQISKRVRLDSGLVPTDE